MKIRPFREIGCTEDCPIEHEHEISDVPRINEIFSQQSFEYMQPDWKAMTGQVLVDENGVVVLALLARPTVEMYAVMDSSEWATPGMKVEHFAELDRVEIKDLRMRGYTDSHCWVPPIMKAFANRIQKFYGWVKSSDPADPWLGLTRKI